MQSGVKKFPLNTVYLYTVSNLLINVLLLGQNVKKKKNHNVSNTWPDFHINISYLISKLIYNLFPYSIAMSPKMHNKHAFSPGVLYIEHV